MKAPQFAFVTPKCCANPSVATMDHRKWSDRESKLMVNRVCLRCYTHWYGEDGANVVEFTRAAWDRWMNSPEQVAA